MVARTHDAPQDFQHPGHPAACRSCLSCSRLRTVISSRCRSIRSTPATRRSASRCPLFVVIIAVAMFGVIAGGVATWFGQHCWRRAAGSMRRTRAMPAPNWLICASGWPRRGTAETRFRRPAPAPALPPPTWPSGETSTARRCRTRPAVPKPVFRLPTRSPTTP